MIADKNLLMGILALQMEIITDDQLIAAMQKWVFKKSTAIEDILLELQFIDRAKRDFLRAIAVPFLALHENDPINSLASLSSWGAVQKLLRDLQDEDVDQSINRLLSVRKDSDSTEFGNRPTISQPSPNQSGNARFRVLRLHAKGGLGQVSIAEDTELHREVALKEIQSKYSSHADSRSRFLVEAEVTGQLEHPGIVPVYSLGTTSDGCPFYVMRFVKGDSMKEAIDRLHEDKKRLSADEFRMALRRLIRRLIDVCNAMHYAHSRGVLHRDLKPGNIMLGKYGETLVVDWGLAKTGRKSGTHKDSEENTCIPASGDSVAETRLGTIVGTLAFMSPEQAAGKLDDLAAPSDVYGLGATLYCALTQKSPIEKLPHEEMLRRVIAGQVVRPREIDPTIPRALEAICCKAMSLRPADRYQSTAALAEDLELWLADEPVTAFREPIRDKISRWVRKNRTLVATGGALLLALVVGLVIVNVMVRQQNAALKVAKDEAETRRREAEGLRTVAEQRTREVTTQKERAEENLAVARTLSLTMLTAAEDTLSKSNFTLNMVPGLRSTLTETAFDSFQKIHKDNPQNRSMALEFARVARISSNLRRLNRDFAVADERIDLSLKLQLAVPVLERTAEQEVNLADTYRDLGTLRKAEGKLLESEEALKTALGISKGLMAKDAASLIYKRATATIELEQSGLSTELLNLDVALSKAESSGRVFEELGKSSTPIATDDYLVLFCFARRVNLLHRLQKHREAKELAANAIPVGQALLKKYLDDGNVMLPYARLLYWDAEGGLDSDGVTEQGNAKIKASVDMLTALVAKLKRAGYLYGLGEALRVQARFLRKQMIYDKANEALSRSRSELEFLLKYSETADHYDVLAKTLAETAALRRDTGDKAAALEMIKLAIDHESKALKLSPANADIKQFAGTLQQELQTLESQ